MIIVTIQLYRAASELLAVLNCMIFAFIYFQLHSDPTSNILLLFQYEECIKDCDKVIESGPELRLDSKMIAIALTRKGAVLVKMAKCSKDYEPAIETFKKALTEHHNPDTLKKLDDAEKAKRHLEQQEHFNPKLADEGHKKGIPF